MTTGQTTSKGKPKMTKKKDSDDRLPALDWNKYQNAGSYNVTLKVTYTKVRKVRAADEQQAMEFAVAREGNMVSQYGTKMMDAKIRATGHKPVTPSGRKRRKKE